MSTLDDVILDEGLRRLAGTGPEFGGGLSNHGPMAAEALLRLGRADEIGEWLDGYIARLDEAPRPGDRITGANWRDALGDLRRAADWEVWFRARIAASGWRAVLGQWWPRLLPGLAAGATHGIIRTSHAARSLADAAAAAGTAEREAELARGLAYWAAGYTELPGTPRTRGTLDLDAALGGLPRAPEIPRRNLITETLGAGLSAQPGFPAALGALRPPGDVAAGLYALAREFAGVFLVYGRARPIALLHAVTAPVAARSVLPLLDESAARPTYDALWQIGAAVYTVYTGALTPEPLPSGPPAPPDVLADRAVAAGDEHAIKLTEACLRLHKERPDPLLLHAAARASDLLGRD
ncbi:MAG TPA: questin oxidase family protein [Trebonia sp.]|nr:questin oxidase family protein [Trebonia sp.]